ncbi:AAA family ATPase [Noviherbaspirillum sp.]|uniref:AAA family ATPase n=1 Tax=Noviherbaspirillum sp. TaxID=1926288 RepID=UPI002FE345C6
MSATLHFLCGKMAAGKTTLSRKLADQHHAILVCEDAWLQQLYSTEIANFDDYLKYSKRLKLVIGPLVTELLCNGISVVLDFPANVPASRTWIRDIFESANAEHVLHFVDTTNERCIEQLKKRNLEKPPGSMEMTVEQFEYITSLFIAPQESEGFNIRTYR